MRTLTVFTPTYNRAYCLGALYESLKRQTSRDFEWLIIDDGSKDDTDALVSKWQKEAVIDIRYIRQNNQGMHGAHNTAYEHIVTELNVCIDSDDYMPNDAVEKIVGFWSRNKSDEVSGFAGLDATTEGRIIGTPFPAGLERSTLFDLYQRHGVTGDKKLVYRSSLTRRHPYPVFEDERYVGLAYKYYKLDQEYSLLLLNEVLCHVDYREDGSSRNMFMQYVRNPQGFSFYRKALMELPFGNLRFKYRQAIHYISSSLFSGNRHWLADTPNKGLTLLAIVPGIALHLYILRKTKSTRLALSRGRSNDYSVG